MKNIEKFTEEADDLVSKLYDLINTLPHKEGESKKLVLKRSIKEVERILNGLEKKDFIKESTSNIKKVMRFDEF